MSPTPPRQSRWRNFLQILRRTTLIAIVAGAGGFYYITQREKHPGPQLPFDPEKKTVVVLGSGWGATSLLSTIDTTDYNVVCDFLSPFSIIYSYILIPLGRYQSQKFLSIHAFATKCSRRYTQSSFHHTANALYHTTQITNCFCHRGRSNGCWRERAFLVFPNIVM